MCDVMEKYMAEARAEGRAEGSIAAKKAERVETIRKMLGKGLSKDFIKSLDYKDDEIKEAEESLMALA